MNQPLRYAVAFDMDGVIFRTTRPKHDAMLSLFPDGNTALISRTILSLSGVPRSRKLAHVYEECFGRHPTEIELQRYLVKYEMALRKVLSKPTITPGVVEFLNSTPSRNFVCSSAPIAEVTHQIATAGLARHFVGTYGAPIPKTEALRAAKAKAGSLPLVFFGDAQADRIAAADAGCAFVAVIGETDQFPNFATPKINDFTSRDAVLGSIETALAENEA